MNTELTALTRPRMASGVSSWTRVWRTTTLTMSAAPDTDSATNDSTKLEDAPNATMARPYTPTASSKVRPTRRCSGQRASMTEVSKAPTAGAPRSKPSPQGPTCRISLANIGSSAVAPPSSTANRSSDTAPRTALRWQMKMTPAKTVRRVTGSRGRGAWS